MDFLTVVAGLSLVGAGAGAVYFLSKRLWLFALAGLLVLLGGVSLLLTYEVGWNWPQWPGSVALMAAMVVLIVATLRLRGRGDRT